MKQGIHTLSKHKKIPYEWKVKTKLPGKFDSEYQEFMKQVGEAIRDRRIELDLTQEKIDRNPLPVDTRKYRRIEYGEENFTMQTLFSLCKNLKISPKELFDKIDLR